MAQLCGKARTHAIGYHPLPIKQHRVHRRINYLARAGHQILTRKTFGISKPIRKVTCNQSLYGRFDMGELERTLGLQRQLFDEPLEELSLKLCSTLRTRIGLPEKFEADGNALRNLDGFLADLAGEEVDASELVRAARKRL